MQIFETIARGIAVDTTYGCHMMSYSYVEEDLNINDHLTLNHE